MHAHARHSRTYMVGPDKESIQGVVERVKVAGGLTASGRVLSWGQWLKTSSVRAVRPERLGHQEGALGLRSPSQLQSLNARLRRLPSCPRPAKKRLPTTISHSVVNAMNMTCIHAAQ